MVPPLDDPEQGLIVARVGRLAALGPADRPADGVGDPLLGGGQSGAVVEAHRHVGAERLLNRDGAFGGELQEAAVDVRAECHAFFRDPRPGRQAEDLEPARIGQDRAPTSP